MTAYQAATKALTLQFCTATRLLESHRAEVDAHDRMAIHLTAAGVKATAMVRAQVLAESVLVWIQIDGPADLSPWGIVAAVPFDCVSGTPLFTLKTERRDFAVAFTTEH